jgi:GDPmannose 4,6-dehydratase
MKILITGVFGQDGFIISELLKSLGHEVHGTYFPRFDDPSDHPFLSKTELSALDITEINQVEETFSSLQPDSIIHLAGETSVASSWESPALTMMANVVGTSNLIETLRKLNSSAHLVNATSVEIFDGQTSVINESSPMKAGNPYGISKLASAQLVTAMRSDGMNMMNVYLSNHESKYRPEKFVMGKLARGVAAIADGRQENLIMGDLSIVRDWSSAEDICKGMIKVVETGFTEDVILASGVNTTLSEIVASAFASVGISNWNDYVTTDPALLRTNDERVVTYDVSLAKTNLDWSATKSTNVWISEMVESFRV